MVFINWFFFLLFHLLWQIDNNWEVGTRQGLQAGHQWIKGCGVFVFLTVDEWAQVFLLAGVSGFLVRVFSLFKNFCYKRVECPVFSLAAWSSIHLPSWWDPLTCYSFLKNHSVFLLSCPQGMQNLLDAGSVVAIYIYEELSGPSLSFPSQFFWLFAQMNSILLIMYFFCKLFY